MKIWKYELEWPVQSLLVPVGATFLSVAVQGPNVCVWAIVDQVIDEREHRMVRVVATGQEFDPEGTNYIGTVQIEPLVYHVFEVLQP